MSAAHYEEIEKALLYVSEARERVESAARTLTETDAEPHLIEALTNADQELLALHGRLMRQAYFGPPTVAQLSLGATDA